VRLDNLVRNQSGGPIEVTMKKDLFFIGYEMSLEALLH
jgi:hypothetical protein